MKTIRERFVEHLRAQVESHERHAKSYAAAGNHQEVEDNLLMAVHFRRVADYMDGNNELIEDEWEIDKLIEEHL